MLVCPMYNCTCNFVYLFHLFVFCVYLAIAVKVFRILFYLCAYASIYFSLSSDTGFSSEESNTQNRGARSNGHFESDIRGSRDLDLR